VLRGEAAVVGGGLAVVLLAAELAHVHPALGGGDAGTFTVSVAEQSLASLAVAAGVWARRVALSGGWGREGQLPADALAFVLGVAEHRFAFEEEATREELVWVARFALIAELAASTVLRIALVLRGEAAVVGGGLAVVLLAAELAHVHPALGGGDAGTFTVGVAKQSLAGEVWRTGGGCWVVGVALLRSRRRSVCDAGSFALHTAEQRLAGEVRRTGSSRWVVGAAALRGCS